MYSDMSHTYLLQSQVYVSLDFGLHVLHFELLYYRQRDLTD